MKENNVNIYKHLKFILPSFLGILIFICPVIADGKVTIPIAILSDALLSILSEVLPVILVSLTGISFAGAVFVKILKRRTKKSYSEYFDVSYLSLLTRGAAFLLSLLIYFTYGWDVFYSEATGGLVFYDLLPVLFVIFLLAGFLLPLLLNFGLLEFSGTLLQKVMKPLFNLPGRSAIDAIASWLGDGTIGVLLTSKQYEEGFYTEREACVIGTSFSLVSITFCLTVINMVGLSDRFIPFYLTVTFASLAAAVITPKIPPLSRKKDLLIDGTKPKREQDFTVEGSLVKTAYQKAVSCAESKQVVKSIAKEGTANVLSMWLSVIPVVLVMGTAALILAEYTPIFRWLGYVFLPLLKLLQIPEAALVSQTLFAGFADMLLPSVMIASATNEMAKFIVAAVSVTQLIYLSEVGALLLGSKIPVKLSELFIIFIERTLITLPIVTLIAYFMF